MKTTLNRIRAKSPCKSGWEKLLRHLGKTEADDEELSILTVLDSNGIYDALWCLRAVEGRELEIRKLACDYALEVAHLLEMPDIVRRYLETQDESIRVEAHTAAYDAYAAAAAAYAASAYAAAYACYAASHAAAASAAAYTAYAAYAAASAAAYTAYAAYAAYAAAYDSAYTASAAARQEMNAKQEAMLRKLCVEITGD